MGRHVAMLMSPGMKFGALAILETDATRFSLKRSGNGVAAPSGLPWSACRCKQ